MSPAHGERGSACSEACGWCGACTGGEGRITLRCGKCGEDYRADEWAMYPYTRCERCRAEELADGAMRFLFTDYTK